MPVVTQSVGRPACNPIAVMCASCKTSSSVLPIPDTSRAVFTEESRQPDLAYVLAVNSSVPAELVPVLYQLLSGVVDAAACRRLNMSPRTFSRRVAEVLEHLGVTTRFQGGAECGRRASMALWWKNQERLHAAFGPAAVSGGRAQDRLRSSLTEARRGGSQ